VFRSEPARRGSRLSPLVACERGKKRREKRVPGPAFAGTRRPEKKAKVGTARCRAGKGKDKKRKKKSMRGRAVTEGTKTARVHLVQGGGGDQKKRKKKGPPTLLPHRQAPGHLWKLGEAEDMKKEKKTTQKKGGLWEDRARALEGFPTDREDDRRGRPPHAERGKESEKERNLAVTVPQVKA